MKSEGPLSLQSPSPSIRNKLPKQILENCLICVYTYIYSHKTGGLGNLLKITNN